MESVFMKFFSDHDIPTGAIRSGSSNHSAYGQIGDPYKVKVLSKESARYHGYWYNVRKVGATKVTKAQKDWNPKIETWEELPLLFFANWNKQGVNGHYKHTGKCLSRLEYDIDVTTSVKSGHTLFGSDETTGREYWLVAYLDYDNVKCHVYFAKSEQDAKEQLEIMNNKSQKEGVK